MTDSKFQIKKYIEPEYKSKLDFLLSTYVNNPDDPITNFELGVLYHSIGQLASAVSFYIRAAERTEDDLLAYESLLRASMCFDVQGTRGISVLGMIQLAVSLVPDRPEGYFHLSRFYEREKRWYDGYLAANLGLKVSKFDNLKPLRYDLDYPGRYGLLFEKAVISWWTGQCHESRETLLDLTFNYPLDSIHKKSVKENLTNLNIWPEVRQLMFESKEVELEQSLKNLPIYLKKKHVNSLRYKFKNHHRIERNYSEAYQDLFVLTMTGGMTEGTFVEIGSGMPFYGNNTFLLENKFNWRGISLDTCTGSNIRYFKDRETMSVNKDAATVDFIELFKQAKLPKNINYLQLDVDTPESNFKCLKNIPFDTHTFSVITYEHDSYVDTGNKFKKLSREYLKEKGYSLAASHICNIEGKNFEDWYIHSSLLDNETVKKFINNDDTEKMPHDLFFKNRTKSKSTIPYISIPLNDDIQSVKDFIKSVDYPVDNLILMNNLQDYTTKEIEKEFKGINKNFVKNLQVVDCALV